MFERNIDSFVEGQLIVLGITSLMDNNYYSEEKFPNAVERTELIRNDISNSAKIPAVITSKRYTGGSPVYDVAFVTRRTTGEISGYIQIIDMPVWRFLVPGMIPQEGEIPNWLINGILAVHDRNYFGMLIDNKQLCYVVEKDGIPELKYLFKG